MYNILSIIKEKKHPQNPKTPFESIRLSAVEIQILRKYNMASSRGGESSLSLRNLKRLA